MVKLYSYYRSSASYRVRIALHWKNIKFDYVPVHLARNGGEQLRSEFRLINPMAHVPALEHDGFIVAESMAILQYLEDVFPQHPLLPSEPQDKAMVLQICELVNSGIQPLQNLKVQRLLEHDFQLSKPDSDRFVRHWIEDGLRNLERLLERTAGSHCLGGTVTMADCLVIPQCVTAARFGVEVRNYPTVQRVFEVTATEAAFQRARPDQQPDFEK